MQDQELQLESYSGDVKPTSLHPVANSTIVLSCVEIGDPAFEKRDGGNIEEWSYIHYEAICLAPRADRFTEYLDKMTRR